MSLETSLRNVARTLLSKKQVDIIIGYEKGSLPLRTTPCFVRNRDDSRMIVNSENFVTLFVFMFFYGVYSL